MLKCYYDIDYVMMFYIKYINDKHYEITILAIHVENNLKPTSIFKF